VVDKSLEMVRQRLPQRQRLLRCGKPVRKHRATGKPSGEVFGVRHSLVEGFDAEILTVGKFFAPKSDREWHDLDIERVDFVLIQVARACR